MPSGPRHGELNAGSVNPSVKSSVSFVAVTDPPTLRLCGPDVYATSTLAPKFVSRILDTIRLINEQGVSVLLVEQALHKTLAIAHHAYVIQTGRIVMEGSGQELLSNEQVKRAYLGM